MTLRSARPRVLSGIQPTADSFHLGNYLGAVRQWVAMQDDHDAFYFVPDLHALTVEHDPKTLAARTRNGVAQLLALGLDPARCTVFVQSHVPEHAELQWVLGCITGFGEASRMTQFKDKAAKQQARPRQRWACSPTRSCRPRTSCSTRPTACPSARTSASTSSSPAISRSGSTRRFGQAFTVPEPYIPPGAAKIQDLQDPTAKMSKSGSTPAGIVNLLDDPKVNAKKIRSAVTDAEREIRYDPEHKPGVSNLLTIYAALTDRKISELEGEYAGRGYGDLKKDLAEVVAAFTAPLRRAGARLPRRPGRARPGPRGGRGAGARGGGRDARGRLRSGGFPAAGAVTVSKRSSAGRIPYVAEEKSKFQQLRERYGWLDHLVRAGERYTERHGDHYAAAVTYFSVLSLVPLLMIAFAIAGFVLRAQPDLLAKLQDSITKAVPGELGETLNGIVDTAIQSAGTVGAIGLLGRAVLRDRLDDEPARRALGAVGAGAGAAAAGPAAAGRPAVAARARGRAGRLVRGDGPGDRLRRRRCWSSSACPSRRGRRCCSRCWAWCSASPPTG